MTAPYPRFGLFNTEERLIHSECVGQAYQIGIWIPFSYAGSNNRYPVLYVPDAEFVFGLACGLIPTLIGTGEIPEVMVVGIGYQGISTWAEHGQLRVQDMCTPGFQQPGGQSRIGAFTEFFRQELMPLIEREYRGLPEDRGLFGFSAGGFFAVHSLFTQPGLFRRHIATSCTWAGADTFLLDCEAQYAAQPVHPPTDLFLAVGALEAEQQSGFQALGERLRGRNYPGFRLATRVFEGEGHNSGTLAKTFLEGVRAVYKA